jgi:hypothetical protein
MDKIEAYAPKKLEEKLNPHIFRNVGKHVEKVRLSGESRNPEAQYE